MTCVVTNNFLYWISLQRKNMTPDLIHDALVEVVVTVPQDITSALEEVVVVGNDDTDDALPITSPVLRRQSAYTFRDSTSARGNDDTMMC
jgi:hypothetical protein